MSIGILAIFSGLLGAYGLRAVLLSEPKAPPEPPRKIIVPLATDDLPTGRLLKLGDIALHSMTQAQMAERGLANPSVMLNTEQIMGRMVREPIRKGEPFLTTSLFLQGLGVNVAEVLKPGMRAITLDVPPRLGGSVSPGTYVDVLFRSSPRAGDEYHPPIPEATVTLMQGVEVVDVERPRMQGNQEGDVLDVRLSNGRRAAPPPNPAVTIAVSLKQASILRTVEGRGEISLVPRSMEDLETARLDVDDDQLRTTLESLLGLEYPLSFKTEIYRRNAKETRVFGPDEVQSSQRQLQQDADPVPTPSATGYQGSFRSASW